MIGGLRPTAAVRAVRNSTICELLIAPGKRPDRCTAGCTPEIHLHPADPDAAAGDLRLGGDAAATAGMRSLRQQLEGCGACILVVNAGGGSLLGRMALLKAALAWFRNERLRY